MKYIISLLCSVCIVGCCSPPAKATDGLQDARNRLKAITVPSDIPKTVEVTADPFLEVSEPEPEDTSQPVPEEPPITPAPDPQFDKPQPTITFSEIMSNPIQEEVTRTQIVTDEWLVSELSCPACPAARRQFISEGHPADHIITRARALSEHNRRVHGIPYRFSTTRQVIVRSTGPANPATYRSVWPPVWDVEGVKLPSKQLLLSHLRNNPNHSDKPWQAWYLENWKKEQLAALHDDDHTDKVPYEALPTEQMLAADITNTEPSSVLVLSAFVNMLERTQSDPTSDTVYGSWFEYDVNVPDFTPTLIRAVFLDKKYVNETLGVTLTWPGIQTFSLDKTSVTINPPIQVSVKKLGIKVSASVSKISFTPDYKSVTIITPETLIPDLQINFK